MQYPYSANSNNTDNTRNNLKSNNTENQQRDTKDNNRDTTPKSGHPRDTGKSDDNLAHGSFAMQNAQGTQQQQSLYNIDHFEINNKAIQHLYLYYI